MEKNSDLAETLLEERHTLALYYSNRADVAADLSRGVLGVAAAGVAGAVFATAKHGRFTTIEWFALVLAGLALALTFYSFHLQKIKSLRRRDAAMDGGWPLVKAVEASFARNEKIDVATCGVLLLAAIGWVFSVAT